jgi:hypothetical protein
VFGPNDGYLYVSTGDGAGAGDPTCGAQSLQSLLGKILRVDPDNASGGLNYAIPPDNPFAGNNEGYLEEIYAYGLRNPWRFTIDAATNTLWTGDVGQAAWEEIDIIIAGKNYGWNSMEGTHCFASPWSCTPPCDSTLLELPVYEYGHDVGEAIIGGHVYRGPTVPELTGEYIYADYATGIVYSLEYDGINPPVNTELVAAAITPTAFGVDQYNELYICTFQPSGSIFHFAPTYIPQPPVVGDIPDQTIVSGSKFTPINSDLYVTDPDSPDSTIVWTWSGNTNLSVSWTPTRRRIRVRPPRGWIGSETITFTATDPTGLAASDAATFTVNSSGARQVAADDTEQAEDLARTNDDAIPSTTQLRPNYPNPFNPATTIHFDLSHDAWVVLKVYNILGEEVTTLVDGPLAAGQRSVLWDGKKATGEPTASGIYLYTLDVDGVLRTGRMLLAK